MSTKMIKLVIFCINVDYLYKLKRQEMASIYREL